LKWENVLAGIMGLERTAFEENAGLKGVTKKKELMTTYICAVEE